MSGGVADQHQQQPISYGSLAALWKNVNNEALSLERELAALQRRAEINRKIGYYVDAPGGSDDGCQPLTSDEQESIQQLEHALTHTVDIRRDLDNAITLYEERIDVADGHCEDGTTRHELSIGAEEEKQRLLRARFSPAEVELFAYFGFHCNGRDDQVRTGALSSDTVDNTNHTITAAFRRDDSRASCPESPPTVPQPRDAVPRTSVSSTTAQLSSFVTYEVQHCGSLARGISPEESNGRNESETDVHDLYDRDFYRRRVCGSSVASESMPTSDDGVIGRASAASSVTLPSRSSSQATASTVSAHNNGNGPTTQSEDTFGCNVEHLDEWDADDTCNVGDRSASVMYGQGTDDRRPVDNGPSESSPIHELRSKQQTSMQEVPGGSIYSSLVAGLPPDAVDRIVEQRVEERLAQVRADMESTLREKLTAELRQVASQSHRAAADGDTETKQQLAEAHKTIRLMQREKSALIANYHRELRLLSEETERLAANETSPRPVTTSTASQAAATETIGQVGPLRDTTFTRAVQTRLSLDPREFVAAGDNTDNSYAALCDLRTAEIDRLTAKVRCLEDQLSSQRRAELDDALRFVEQSAEMTSRALEQRSEVAKGVRGSLQGCPVRYRYAPAPGGENGNPQTGGESSPAGTLSSAITLVLNYLGFPFPIALERLTAFPTAPCSLAPLSGNNDDISSPAPEQRRYCYWYRIDQLVQLYVDSSAEVKVLVFSGVDGLESALRDAHNPVDGKPAETDGSTAPSSDSRTPRLKLTLKTTLKRYLSDLYAPLIQGSSVSESRAQYKHSNRKSVICQGCGQKVSHTPEPNAQIGETQNRATDVNDPAVGAVVKTETKMSNTSMAIPAQGRSRSTSNRSDISGSTIPAVPEGGSRESRLVVRSGAMAVGSFGETEVDADPKGTAEEVLRLQAEKHWLTRQLERIRNKPEGSEDKENNTGSTAAESARVGALSGRCAPVPSPQPHSPSTGLGPRSTLGRKTTPTRRRDPFGDSSDKHSPRGSVNEALMKRHRGELRALLEAELGTGSGRKARK